MFTTYETFRAPLSRMSGNTDEKFWTTVQLTTSQMWFIATYLKNVSMDEDLVQVKQTLFFSEKSQLDALICTVLRLEEVYIVTPAHVNGGKGWEIELLSKIRNAQEPTLLTQAVHLFETISGRRYTDSLLGTPWEDLLLKDSELCFEYKAS